MIKVQFAVCWVEDGGKKAPRNVGVPPHHCTALQPSKSQVPWGNIFTRQTFINSPNLIHVITTFVYKIKSFCLPVSFSRLCLEVARRQYTVGLLLIAISSLGNLTQHSLWCLQVLSPYDATGITEKLCDVACFRF